jgi:hypothetical protein
MGESALKAPAAVVCPVPPFPMASEVPDQFELFTLERDASVPKVGFPELDYPNVSAMRRGA